MKIFVPDKYYKDIYDIDYKKLKESGIKTILYDLDNTLALISEGKPPKKVLDFIHKLRLDFDIYIVSNNNYKRIYKFCHEFEPDAEFVSFALKPLTKGFKEVQKKKKYKKREMCVVGDQLMTDVFGGNRFGCMTILVDPLGKKDLKVTFFNRFLENRIINHLSKKQILERGKYYE